MQYCSIQKIFTVKTYIKMYIGIVVCWGFEKYEALKCIKY
jgi:hypothetical protein